jgi:hypothetical protein
MAITPKFRAKIIEPTEEWSDGWQLYDADLKKYDTWLKSFKPGTHVFVTIRKIEKKQIRSIVQNNYYHGVVLKLLSEFTGYEREEMHEALKIKFLTYENVKGLPVTMSTTQLKTHEFEEYLERIRRWASMDLGVYIPMPKEVESK